MLGKSKLKSRRHVKHSNSNRSMRSLLSEQVKSVRSIGRSVSGKMKLCTSMGTAAIPTELESKLVTSVPMEAGLKTKFAQDQLSVNKEELSIDSTGEVFKNPRWSSLETQRTLRSSLSLHSVCNSTETMISTDPRANTPLNMPYSDILHEPVSRTESIGDSGGSSNDLISSLKQEQPISSLACSKDPRHQIFNFFSDVDSQGTFSVWRPTSKDAIGKMMSGEGTGKGLDVKGKSAKIGKLSGFIPFLQIHEERHKSKIRTLPRDGMIRVYFKSEAVRNRAALELTSISNEMKAIVSKAKRTLITSCTDEIALENIILDVVDPKVYRLDDYSPINFGIAVAERIFLNTYISRQDITRCSDYQTGRKSEPDFQDMNFACMREYKSGPRPVVLQLSDTVDGALCPQSLVVAYAESNTVIPVLSDFDCFLVGTRSIDYEQSISEEQLKLVKWLLTQIEKILDSPVTSKSWTSRWLEVLKESASKGFFPKMPKFGFGDPKSYAIMKGAVSHTGSIGAVRHGAECFNYTFPQELDNEFLVISDDEGNTQDTPWKYINRVELQDMLCKKIEGGFTFPLNLKWILADCGWKAIYDKMTLSTNKSVQKSLAVWYPPESGIREHIEDIHRRFPDGFQTLEDENSNNEDRAEGTEAMDLAEQALRRHIILQRAKFKLRCALRLMALGRDMK